MIFQTGLLRLLTEAGHQVSVIVPDARDPNVAALAERDGVETLEYTASPSAAQRPLKALRKYVVEDIRNNPCLWDKHRESIRKAGRGSTLRRAFAGAGLLLNDVVDRAPVLRSSFLAGERNLLRRKAALDFITGLAPDLVVATYPVAFPEPELLLAAEATGVTTAIHLLSWDNITAKGHFQALADHYIAWGPTMAEELREHYGVSEDRIHQCGVPHFDLYFKDRGRPDGALPRRLEAGGRYLFFAMSASRYAPGETGILRRLCEETLVGGELEGLRVVARPHPSALSGVMQDEATLLALRRLEAEAGLLLSLPRLVKGSKMNWSVRDDDMHELVALIKGAAVVLNSGSTVNVEALAMGRPVVVTSYDGPDRRPYESSAARLRDYPHLRKLFADGGAEVVTSHGELVAALKRLINDPERGAAGRAHALRRQIGDQRGDATRKVADALAHLLQAESPKVATRDA